MNARKTTGLALLGVGIATITVSFLGTTFEWGKKTTVATARATTTTEKGRKTAETVNEFTKKWQGAFRSGDIDFLLARLHPASIERYGEAACTESIKRQSPDPGWTITVKKVSDLGVYDYASDALSTVVNGVYTVTVIRETGRPSQTGQESPPAESDIHLALVEGKLRWFSDCGTPLAKA